MTAKNKETVANSEAIKSTGACSCSRAVTGSVGLALRFHNAYERLAPSFGYETRGDTKSFDESSPNGKLMIAVCNEVMGDYVQVLKDISEMPSYDQDDHCRLRHKAQLFLSQNSVISETAKDKSD